MDKVVMTEHTLDTLHSPVWAVRGPAPDPRHHVTHHHPLHLQADGAAVDGLLLL